MGGRITVRKPVGAAPVCASSNVGRAGGLNKGVNKGKAPMRRGRDVYMQNGVRSRESVSDSRARITNRRGEGERPGRSGRRETERS